MGASEGERRPLIGLTTYRETATWGIWDTTADVLPAVYARALEVAGAAVVLLPPQHPDGGAPEAVVAALDGLVVTGGADVSPHRYADAPHERTQAWRDDRDAWELALLEAAAARALPVLGICRGMQVMAVAAGGRLEQHVPDRVGHENHSPGGDVFGEVAVAVREGTRVHDLVGDRLTVRCHHHQGVLEHPGFDPVAWAADETLEAMERPGDRFEVAVQWHPEMVEDAGLFRGVVAAARAGRGSGQGPGGPGHPA
ncbi:gamma-glutamyl-gamma-aminobutyrate hydrolase family protein [Nocardioides sp. HDW12B]|uniref:gamma-glutamyl-gamma-aminobutyrate hydrolase family protein n=1 Tax=Nocardioides sp. HDW12B TaxID=2714939 RepID=UPI001409D6C4|nr:gamma-glutamyl-gamma-aminobutyrate hydrolase family protein [Nocardioides sp. HDW12B]QIK67181.1 gamma-glutamyl-gamma-aminobutyrate hydrolase family protein [Nocardioides sp. HDW12B]